MEIVVTIGPSTEQVSMFRLLDYAGATVFRLNLSYVNALNHIKDFVNAVKNETNGKACLDLHGAKHRPDGSPSFTSFDIKAMELRAGFDQVAVSFTRSAEAVIVARDLSQAPCVVAKIECPIGVQNRKAIAEAADVLLIDRGDLCKTIPIEDIPRYCIELIQTAKEAGIPCWIATNLLDSMVREPRPTLSEVHDIAWLIFHGVDGFVLAGETAVGKYPVQATAFIKRMTERYMK